MDIINLARKTRIFAASIRPPPRVPGDDSGASRVAGRPGPRPRAVHVVERSCQAGGGCHHARASRGSSRRWSRSPRTRSCPSWRLRPRASATTHAPRTRPSTRACPSRSSPRRGRRGDGGGGRGAEAAEARGDRAVAWRWRGAAPGGDARPKRL